MGEAADWEYERRQGSLSAMCEITEALEDYILNKYDIDPNDADRVYDAIASKGQDHNNLDDACSDLMDKLQESREASVEEDSLFNEGSETADLLRLKQNLKKVLFGSA